MPPDTDEEQSILSTLDRTFRVPATRGKRGNAWCYTATLPLGVVGQLLANTPEGRRRFPENRNQQVLDTDNVPVTARHIVDHADRGFSGIAITVSVDSDHVEFVEVAECADIGELALSLQAKYVINNGQYRVAGIAEALRSNPALAQDTISVVFLPIVGLERGRRIFSDPHRAVRKPSKRLSVEDAQRPRSVVSP